MQKHTWFDSSKPFGVRVSALMKAMTVDEKMSQLLYTAPAIPRLGIPEYNWWNEALHGVARAGRATVFPQAIANACTFDRQAIRKMGHVIGLEGRAKYLAAKEAGQPGRQYFGLTFWSPNINIFRDSRWGRGQETYGEDPYLTGELGKAFVQGVQGSHRKYLLAAACAKHFWGHSGPEALRHGFNARISKYDAATTYLPAFQKLVQEAHVEGVMGAYNRTNGEVCCGSRKFLRELLRDAWGFDGYVTSDCGAIFDIFENHKATPTLVAAAAMALKNGCNINCGCAYQKLREAFDQKLIAEADLDDALRHAMMTRMRLGLFDDPKQVPYALTGPEVLDCPAHRKIARQLALESMVLLENNGILPLKKEIPAVAITGPNAFDLQALWGNYNGFSANFSTPATAITGKVSGGTLVTPIVINAFPPAGDRDPAIFGPTVIYCAGLNEGLEGEESPYGKGDRLDLALPPDQRRELDFLYEKGAKVILVIFAGSPIDLSRDRGKAAAIVYAPYPGEAGGEALADLLFGDANFSGRLPITFPAATADLPPFEDYSMTGRTYRFLTKAPAYPFGYGLSYTKFRYSEFAVTRSGNEAELSVNVQNAGAVAGDEIVQVYLKAPALAGAPQENCRLAAFLRIHLAAGAAEKVALLLPAAVLQRFDAEGKPHAPAAVEYEFYTGCDASLKGAAKATLRFP